MLSFQGIGATEGKGSGVAIIHKKAHLKSHTKYFGEQAKELFFEARDLAVDEIISLMELCKDSETRDIYYTHQLLLQDPEVEKKLLEELDLNEELFQTIKKLQQFYKEKFEVMENEIFRSKALDIEEVFERLLKQIKKQSTYKSINKNFILVCEDLMPTTIYDYPLEYLKGVVVKKGSLFSHGVIIARSKNIPVVIGLTQDFEKIKPSDYLVVDGLSGKVVLISE
ncbi:MAG: PEP-utilizing enzyme [Candidatus Izemoplasmatales bacterium]|nr:PEP-utilizing enzyme [Candidatus Izemoplasmatales bacterium]